MRNGSLKYPPYGKIDIEKFFGLLREKLGKNQREVVTAAMAESVRHSAVDRVLAYSDEPRDRIAELRKVLRARIRPLKG